MAHSELSDAVSKDLKKRGMKFVGTTIIYAYLQSVGVIYSHDKDCFWNMACRDSDNFVKFIFDKYSTGINGFLDAEFI